MGAVKQLGLGLDGRPGSPVAGLIREAVEWAGGLPADGLSPEELELLERAGAFSSAMLRFQEEAPAAGEDPFARALLELRSVEKRRDTGQFFTPQPIVDVMVDWVKEQGPSQVVDAGCGTGRFAIAAARAMPDSRVIAMDADPVATLICRAYARRLHLDNLEVRCGDFLQDPLPLDAGRAAFLGNPPYVRHHRLSPELKAWGAVVSGKLGIRFSKLAGLHLYFFLATALRARPEDVGCYITSSEWLDVGYGEGLRQLLRGPLGVTSVSVLAESAVAFEDAMTTAAITCFRVGSKLGRVRFSVVPEFRTAEGPASAKTVAAEELQGRWGLLLRRAGGKEARSGWVRLGDIASVHRGIATGANDFFVLDRAAADRLGLSGCVRSVVTGAEQILGANGTIDAAQCKALLTLPRDIDSLPPPVCLSAQRYLARGEAAGIPDRYLCRHRQPWWWLGASEAPPIVATYMARRPPAFALNPDGALILNIAHGIFPREPMGPDEMRDLVNALNLTAPTFVGNGRRYQGGLEKFEPREMEDLLVPPLSCALR